MSHDDACGVTAFESSSVEPEYSGYCRPWARPIQKHTSETGLAHCLNDAVRRPIGTDSEKLLSVSVISPSLIQSGEDPTAHSINQAAAGSAFATTGQTVQPLSAPVAEFGQDKAPTIQAASVSTVLAWSRSDSRLRGMLERKEDGLRLYRSTKNSSGGPCVIQQDRVLTMGTGSRE
ncbi:MAG: hypothetical protein JSU65_13345, partial [Candidatus Zixiibacteriota bacterium]